MQISSTRLFFTRSRACTLSPEAVLLAPIVAPVVIVGSLALIAAFGLLCALLNRLFGRKAAPPRAHAPRSAPPAPPATAAPSGTPSAAGSDAVYTVFVDDNFHYMDERYRTVHGTFATLDAAVAACRAIVERSLRESRQPGMTAEALFTHYRNFGEDPFIRGPGVNATAAVPFSGWTYARRRAEELSAGQE